jgi:ADP-heptose:LPS heptosyltransferase
MSEASLEAGQLTEQMETRATPVRKALIVHMLALGEGVFALPLLHALQHAPQPYLIVSVANSLVGDLLEASGLTDVVLRREDFGGAAGPLKLLWEVRRQRPDLCFALAPSDLNSLLARLSGARRAVGYENSDWSRLLETVPFEGGGVEHYLSLLDYVGIPRTTTSYCGLLHAPPAAHEEAREVLQGVGVDPAGPFVLLAPISTGKKEEKSYPLARWAQVARGLAQRGWPALLVGSPADREEYAEIVAQAGAGVHSLAGKTSSLGLAALSASASCLVGIDTGPVHVAAAMGTPCVVLFGSSDPTRTAPCGEGHTIFYADLDCQPCHVGPCERAGACLTSITVEQILEAVERTMERQALLP